jgi:hypothetical protein
VGEGEEVGEEEEEGEEGKVKFKLLAVAPIACSGPV